MERTPKLPFYVLLLWLGSILVWWMFAFFPTPSEPPAWLAAARVACFGSMKNGLPDAGGWLLLVLAPLSFLIGISLLWGTQLWQSIRGVAKTSVGKAVIMVMITLAAIEVSWIARKVQTARTIAAWSQVGNIGGTLDENYPRGVELAPDFKLVDEGGNSTTMSQFRGQTVLLTFAFAHCSSVCPLLIQTAKTAIVDFPQVTFLTVTLDPWRDTPSTLMSLKEEWGLDMRSHVLSAKKVDDVLLAIKSYKVQIDRNETTGDVVHPGLVFIIDSEGRIAYTFNSPPASWISEGLRRIIGAGAQTQGPTSASSQQTAQSH